MRLVLRAFLLAIVLGGLLVPSAFGSWPMYNYASLMIYGQEVYGYAETDIDIYWDCGWGCGGSTCWVQYRSWAEVTLYWDGLPMDNYWYEQPNGWASAWVYANADPGSWGLWAEHGLPWYWYRDEYCMDWWGDNLFEEYWLEQTVDPGPDPEIYIADTQDVWDGDAGYFNVVAEGGTPTWYEWWLGNYFSPAGNSPYVNFSPPNGNPTVTDAHWYAYPDQECVAQYYAYYEIDVDAWFGSIQRSAMSWMNVWVPVEGGQTWPPQFTSLQWFYMQCGNNYCPSTAFTTSPPTTMIGVSYQSQFFQKAWEHEQVHVNQFTGPMGMMNDVYSATELANRVAPLSDPTQQGLHTKVWDEINAYLQWSASEMNTRRDAAEIQAYAVSDVINPRYLWQRCGRVHF